MNPAEVQSIRPNLPFNVLALVTDAFGGAGGIAQYNRDFIEALAADGQVGAITVAPRLAPKPDRATPPRTHQVDAIKDQLHYTLNALRLALRERPDVIFCGHLYMAPLGLIAAKLAGAKLILQLHGIEIWPRPSRLQSVAIEAADLICCVSRDTRARLLNWTRAEPERVVVTPNTVSDRYAPGDGAEMRTAQGLGEKVILLSVSRLDANQRYKGQDLVISLIPTLRARGRDLVFLIGGSGDDQSRLETLASDQGVAEHVRFLGEVPNDQLLSFYRAADLYLMPSSGEGFGIVFLEAMACGAPAIGLDLGGARDALGRGLGEAVEPDQLLSAIERALDAGRPDSEAQVREVRRRYGRDGFRTRISGLISRLGEASARSALSGRAAA
jgi:phosphatidylinositol alpha-1,6-mannosyltransferase